MQDDVLTTVILGMSWLLKDSPLCEPSWSGREGLSIIFSRALSSQMQRARAPEDKITFGNRLMVENQKHLCDLKLDHFHSIKIGLRMAASLICSD